MILFIKRIFLICLLSITVLYLPLVAQQTQAEKSNSVLRIGTFDSRALAIAYYRSPEFMKYMQGLQNELREAKAANDEQRVKELEEIGPAQQELIHKQGFSTWPVDNILEKIKEHIPEILNQADVDVIICKWDIVYQKEGVEFVDVTDLMVKPFKPDQATLKVLQEMKSQSPVPLEELAHSH